MQCILLEINEKRSRHSPGLGALQSLTGCSHGKETKALSSSKQQGLRCIDTPQKTCFFSLQQQQQQLQQQHHGALGSVLPLRALPTAAEAAAAATAAASAAVAAATATTGRLTLLCLLMAVSATGCSSSNPLLQHLLQQQLRLQLVLLQQQQQQQQQARRTGSAAGAAAAGGGATATAGAAVAAAGAAGAAAGAARAAAAAAAGAAAGAAAAATAAAATAAAASAAAGATIETEDDGCGKSTLCWTLQQQFEVSRHRVVCINLDPAAEYIPYKPDIDVKELITADEVGEELGLGPNGSLVYCIEYLEQNKEWLEEKILETGEDELLLFDLPGQIELFVHLDAFRHIATFLERQGVRLCVAYCLDIAFFADAGKLLSGSLLALNAMLFFELPHVNVLTKCDLVAKANITSRAEAHPHKRSSSNRRRRHRSTPAAAARSSSRSSSSSSSEESEEDEDEEESGNSGSSQWAGRSLDAPTGEAEDEATEEDIIVERLLAKDVQQIIGELDTNMPVRYRALHAAFGSLLEEFGLVSFFPLNINQEDSIIDLGALLRSTLQADEDQEPRMDFDFGAE
ncbi:hypothetical protein Emed_006399 [Eimeria media]